MDILNSSYICLHKMKMRMPENNIETNANYSGTDNSVDELNNRT